MIRLIFIALVLYLVHYLYKEWEKDKTLNKKEDELDSAENKQVQAEIESDIIDVNIATESIVEENQKKTMQLEKLQNPTTEEEK